uniref:TIL domain-containing protein n=1 Tax=Anopheles maculatus TaxID=74869 RepID=A0A182SMQ1_9DIPT
MQLYGKLCSLFLLLAWCNVVYTAVAPNIQVCPNFEEYTFSYECQPTCANRLCTITSTSPKREGCTCKLGYIRQVAKGPCIRNSQSTTPTDSLRSQTFKFHVLRGWCTLVGGYTLSGFKIAQIS